MKTIYLCNDIGMIKRIYRTNDAAYRKDDLFNNPDIFSDTEYVFSTWGMPQLTEEEIKKYLPRLKCVFYAAGSVQAFARPFLNCGVKVFSAWAANAVPVAEVTVAQIVLANKGFFKTMRYTDRTVSRRVFDQYKGNYDVKVGLIGAGMIGSLVAKMLQAYNMQVLVFDPFLSDERAKTLNVEKCSLDTIFEECTVVSNHLANNEQTRGMLTGALFSKMLPYSTFLNTGRGAQVVETDLVDVLKSRPDLTAILDVTDPEPPIDGSELYTLENCILTPHIAGSDGNEVARMAEYMRIEYESFIKGEPCKFEVNAEMLKTMA